MFSKILVPLDGSVMAERALTLAAHFVDVGGGRLVLYRVVPYFTVLAADPLLYEEMNRLGEDEAIAYLRLIRNDLTIPNVTDLVCEVGSAADSILQYAQEKDVDLIVMSSHGRSGLNRWVYGSVAERIMSQAPCPTLIVNSRQPSTLPVPPKNILVPLTDLKLGEEGAQTRPGDRRPLLDSEIHLLRVTTSGEMRIETASKAEVFTDLETGEVVQAQAYLQEQVAKLDGVVVQQLTSKSPRPPSPRRS